MGQPSNADLQRQITALAAESRTLQGELIRRLDKVSDKIDASMEKLAKHDEAIDNLKAALKDNADDLEKHGDKEFQFSLAVLVSFLTGLGAAIIAWFKH